ncbi:MAG: ankyrin repeat domain-containing protein, partial [bacterium]|nr:ankyrin repeat domain-containing protein [bacterium]
TIMEQNRENRRKHGEMINNAAIEKVKAAMKKDRDYLKKRNKEGASPLDGAIEKELGGAVRFMVEKGAPMNTKNGIGYTALHWAVVLGKKEIVDILIRAGADVNVRASTEYAPLHDATHAGYEEIVRLLLAGGADPYAEVQGKTPFQLARGQMKMSVCKLVKPIHTAAEKGDIEKVKTFLERKPDLLDFSDEESRTPLHAAVNAGHKNIVSMLIKRGAAMEIRDKNGYLPLETARRKGYDDIEHMLLNKGARITDKEALAKNLKEKEAFLWQLNTYAWAVKTKNHFLVFDYTRTDLSKYFSWAPKRKVLGNGFINPRQIKDQQVTVFIANRFVNSENPNEVLNWQPHIPRINYIFGYDRVGGPGMVSMKARTKQTVGDLEVTTMSGQGGGLVFLVKADGMTVLFANVRIGIGANALKKYKAGIDYLAANGPVPDVAFLPLCSEDYLEKDQLENGTLYALEMLKPATMYPLPYGTGKVSAEAFGKKAAAGVKTKIRPLSTNGNRVDL